MSRSATTLLVAAAGVVAALIGGPAAAQAAPATGSTVITVDDGPTSLTITTDKPMSKQRVDLLKAQLKAGVRDTTGNAAPRPGAAAPNPPVISCREGVRFFTDTKGTASFRFNCKYNNINWGFKFAPKLQSIAAGPVDESGAVWYRNGRYAGKNAAHSGARAQPAWYHFHGTFPNILKGDRVSWLDTYTFKCNVGARCKAVLKVGGTFVVKK
ncbi:MAG: hypothetical protein HOV94_03460 [Saccharothrix sp.]|nr:hypothetical protein [Saccharothrix sp.]